MLQNVIELGKSDFGDALNKILEDIFVRNVEKKGNDGQGNKSKGDKEGQYGNNEDNEYEEGKDTCYLNDSINNFISTMFDKQDGNKRILITQSLCKFLEQNIFH